MKVREGEGRHKGVSGCMKLLPWLEQRKPWGSTGSEVKHGEVSNCLFTVRSRVWLSDGSDSLTHVHTHAVHILLQIIFFCNSLAFDLKTHDLIFVPADVIATSRPFHGPMARKKRGRERNLVPLLSQGKKVLERKRFGEIKTSSRISVQKIRSG